MTDSINLDTKFLPSRVTLMNAGIGKEFSKNLDSRCLEITTRFIEQRNWDAQSGPSRESTCFVIFRVTTVQLSLVLLSKDEIWPRDINSSPPAEEMTKQNTVWVRNFTCCPISELGIRPNDLPTISITVKGGKRVNAPSKMFVILAISHCHKRAFIARQIWNNLYIVS